MNIKDVWVTLRIKGNKSLLANLYWLIAWRMHGVYICDDLVDREIELSNGNMYWEATNEATAGKHIVYKFCLEDGMQYGVCVTEDIAYINFTGTPNKLVNVLESDSVTEALKRNKRLKLVGSEEYYKSDGVEMIKFIGRRPNYHKDTIATNDRYIEASESEVEVAGNLTVNVTDFYTLSLVDYDYIEVYITALGKKKHLRLLEANDSNTSLILAGIDINRDITVEWGSCIGLSNNNLKSLRRLNNCVIYGREDYDTYDFSNIDYINPYVGVNIDAPGESLVLDFGNKFICMSDKSIKSQNTNVLIVYSNPKMTGVLKELEKNNEDGTIKVKYQGE